MNDILFITAYKDIGRSNWITHKRTTDDYLNYFLNILENIEYKLLVFLDDDVKEKILNICSIRENIIFLKLSDVELFYDTYLETQKNVMGSLEFQKKVPIHRFRKHPETWSAKYNLINHSKVNFVRHSKQLYPEYKFYSWIDFGFVRDCSSLPKKLNVSKFPEKIMYQSFKTPDLNNRINAIQMLQINEPFIAGSAFIVPNSLVEKFENIYEKKIIQWEENYISDDDQSLVLQLYYENPSLFYLILENEWFSLYKHLNN
jgi:hypothetical protein